MRPPASVAWMLLALGTSPVALGETGEGENFFVQDVVTPHVPWGRPYAKGPVRVLAIVHGKAVRNVIELSQRLDMKVDGVLPDRDRDVLRKIQGEWDCAIVGGGGKNSELTPEAQVALLEHVIRGRGLVVTEPGPFPPGNPPGCAEDMDLLIAGTPGGGFTTWLDPLRNRFRADLEKLGPGDDPAPILLKTWTMGRIGEGRAVRLAGFSDGIDYGTAQTRYEYYQALVARAVLWACAESRRPDLRFAELRATRTSTGDRWSVDGIVANRSAAAIRADAQVIVRRSDGLARRVAAIRCRIPAGGQTRISQAVPVCGPLGHFVDLILESPRGHEIWGSCYFDPGLTPGIKEVVIDKSYAEVGEAVSGRVVPGDVVPEKSRVRVDLVDTFGRTLARYVLPPGTEVFSIPVEGGTSQVVRVRAAVVPAQSPAGVFGDWTEAVVGVPRRGAGEFNYIMWSGIDGVAGYWARERLRKVGITAELSGPQPGYARRVAMSNLMTVPYATHLGRKPADVSEPDPAKRRSASFNDDAARAAHIRDIVAACRECRAYGCLAYSLGDEVPTRYFDATPHCLAAYRRYLEAVYGTIDALNQEWGEKYASFTDVRLLNEKDPSEAEALSQEKFARWCDRELFAHWNMLQICRQFAAAFREQLNDPEGKCGYEGAGGFGDDVDEILDSMTFWGPYPGFGNELLRSLASPDFLSSNWYGYSNTAAPLIRKYYDMVRSGLTCVAWWRIDHFSPYRPYIGFLAPAYNFHPAVAELWDETRWVREGGGTLLMHLPRPHDAVAFFYSPASAISSTVQESNRFNDHAASAAAWAKVTQDLGLQYRFVTGRRIAGGELERSGYKVLVMPFAQAVSEGEAAAIARFVRSGGTVIADLRPGVFDGHCKPMAKGGLDDVFGISRLTTKAVPKPVTIPCPEGVAPDTATPMPLSLADPSVQATTAQVQGERDGVPMVLVNRSGSGTAVLLNFHITRYPSLRLRGEEGALRNLLGSLYQRAGVRARIRTEGPDGAPLRASVMTRWGTPDAGEILGLMTDSVDARASGKPERVVVRMAAAMYAYDLKAGKYLGAVDTIARDLIPGRMDLIAVWPHRIGKLGLQLSATRARLGDRIIVHVRLKGPLPDDVQVVRLTARSPRGELADWWTQQVVVRGGSVDIPVRIAIDEDPGTWVFEATDILSGQKATARLHVAGTAPESLPWPRCLRQPAGTEN